MTTARTPAVGALILAAVVVAGACSGDEPEPEARPEAVLAEAKRQLDETAGVHVALSTDRLPNGVDGILSASGFGTHAPAFEGDLKIASGGITADVPVVAVKGAVYAQLPFSTQFARIDPGDYSAPDPADLMATEGGLSDLLTSAEDVERGEEVRSGEDVLTEYVGTVPGRTVASIIPSASPEQDFDAAFTVADDGLLRTAELTGPFYPRGGEVTYVIEFDQYGEEREITAP